MRVDQAALGQRLREARENRSLTQQQAADAVSLSRPAIAQIEAGRRSVSTLELSAFTSLYRRRITELLSDTFALDEQDDPVAYLRVDGTLRSHPEVQAQVEYWIGVCSEGAQLEQLLGAPNRDTLPSYSLPEPKSFADAFSQGEQVAAQERRRLGLGEAPVHGLPDLIASEGVWVAGVRLPPEMSGLFLHHSSIGSVILVNNGHPRVRKRFSYAHEYAHALIDKQRGGLVSTRENATDRTEKRANAFAAAFLMPEDGVRSFLSSRDKRGASRRVHAVYGVEGAGEEAEERAVPGSQRIIYQDVALLARSYGVSYGAAVYRLQDVGLLNAAERQSLLAQKPSADAYLRLLHFTEAIDDGATDDKVDDETNELISQVVYRAIEAFRREEISRGRLLDLSKKLRLDGAALLELAEAAR